MSQTNFQHLQNRWPQLYEHANFAEQYVYSDSHTSIIKLRCIAEQLIGILYRELDLPCEPNDGFYDKLTSRVCADVIDENILEKLHAIRILGNKAAHGKCVKSGDALTLLRDAYLISQWLFKTYSGALEKQYPQYIEPLLPTVSQSTLTNNNEKLEMQLQAVKDELYRLQESERNAQNQKIELQKTLDEVKIQNFREASSNAASLIDLVSENTREHINLDDAFSEYTLTNGQKELIKNVDKFLKRKDDKVFLLKGYAGTGKTFIIKGLTDYFRARGRNFVLAAPTGKASKVIAEKTKCLASTIHKSIYSFDDIVEYRDQDLEGSETYKFYAQLAVNDLSADTVFIVDEASMVSDVYQEEEFFRFGSGYLLRDFFKFANLDHNDHIKKVIFIGDNAQLPPVGMNFSPALDEKYLLREHNYKSASFELTEVVRHKANSGVMLNSIELRKSLDKDVFNQLTMRLDFPDVEQTSHENLLQNYLDSCGGKINGESILLAYSNADVAAYNRQIREYFFPNSMEVTRGDKVMAVKNSYSYGLNIYNGDFGLIQDVLSKTERRNITLRKNNSETNVIEEITVPLSFRDVSVGFKNLDGDAHFFKAKIIEDLLYSDHPVLTSDESKALYLDFCIRHPQLKRKSHEFKQTLAADPYFNALRVKFGYAITCHKAQGSEWNNVFVKCKTHQNQLSASYFRWLYTAITRSSQKLFLLDPPNLRLGKGIKVVASPNFNLDQATEESSPFQKQGQTEQLAMEPRPTVTELYGIPTNAYFSIEILQKVNSLIEKTGIKIQDVRLEQYQEIYFFQKDDEIARIDIRYNGKNKITSITAPKQTDLSLKVIERLNPLKGMLISIEPNEARGSFDFGEEFLHDFHKRLSPLVEQNGITISSVEPLDWNQRYTFIQYGERAVVDIFYNGKSRFTKCSLVKNACTSDSLSNTVLGLITEELN